MTSLDFPTGSNTAISGPARRLSFDDLHLLRPLIRAEIDQRLSAPATRILGCLEDDETALLALLFVTEITDYMPINPNLSDLETTALASGSRADAAIVSSGILARKGDLFTQSIAPSNVLIWDDIVTTALATLATNNSGAPPQPTDATTPGRLILHTSGSTGQPKRVPITLGAVNASAKNIAAGHGLTQDDHALNALPTFHIGALVDVMLAPFAAHGTVSITNKRTPNDLIRAVIETRPTWVQTVPTVLRRLVEDVDPTLIKDARKSLRFIRSISAPVPADLKAQAETLFGCPIIEMYGMTETAGQIATNARDPAAHKPGSVGKPIGVDVAILDRYANPVPQGQTGEICVSGPTVFDGYEGTARDEVFFEEWFRTGDLGALDADGYLFLRGRLKEMINIGGEKVSPLEVETAALRHPDVIEAAAFAVPHPTLGEQTGLTVATRTPIDQDTLKTFLETQLAGFKCPNAIAFADQLPRLANAKVDRVLLKREAENNWTARLETQTIGAGKPATPEAAAIALHWSKLLKCRPPEGEDDFFDMGGDSLSATQLLLSLEKALNRDISPNQLFETPTFAGLVATLTQRSEAPSTQQPRPVRYVQQRTAGWPGQVAMTDGLLRSIGSLKPGHPLFWASQAEYEIQAMRDTLGQRRPLYVTGSLRHFKRRTKQDFKVVGQKLAQEIAALQPDGPIALGGFCGGAWVMHHAAQALIAMGRDIRVFFSFDYWPSRPLQFPTVHCMSDCEVNSARINYADHSLAHDLLHDVGAMTLHVTGRHRFIAADLAPHAATLNAILDGTPINPDICERPDDPWPLTQRQAAPRANIAIKGRPRLYQKGQTRSFTVSVKNTSDQTWEPTKSSGLSLQVDLINLDGYMRQAKVAYGAFDSAIGPGQTTAFTFDVTFPEKRVPLWLSCNLVSQGLKRFTSRASGGHKTLVFPRP